MDFSELLKMERHMLRKGLIVTVKERDPFALVVTETLATHTTTALPGEFQRMDDESNY